MYAKASIDAPLEAHIAGAGNGALMFYNQANGRWATGRLQPDGRFDTIHVGNPGEFAAWTHIAGAEAASPTA